MKKYYVKLMALVCVISVFMTTPAMADSNAWMIKRENGDSYIKTVITWNWNSEKVKSSSAVQSHSGLFVDEGGVERVIKAKKKHKWSCKSKFYLGINTPVGTIGYSKVWNDFVTVFNSAIPTIEWDED